LEDSDIVALANAACRTIKLSGRIDPQRVVWSKAVSSDESDLTAGVRRTGLVLPVSLRGKLTLEEWNPLIVANLIRFKDGHRFLRTSTRLVFLLLVTAGTGFLAQMVLGPSWAWSALLFAIPALFFLLRDSVKWLKKEALKLDARTASIAGSQSLLYVLRKIQDMHLDDVERLSQRRGFYARVLMSARPSLAERIAFLERNSARV